MRYLAIAYRFTLFAAIGLIAISLSNEATQAWEGGPDSAGEVGQVEPGGQTDAKPSLLANLTTLGFLVLGLNIVNLSVTSLFFGLLLMYLYSKMI